VSDDASSATEPFPDPTTEVGQSQVSQMLQRRRAELQNLQEISEGARDAVTLDQQSVGRLSRMDALQQQAMAQANARQRLAELHRIDRALTRLNDGDFGYCEVCDEQIPRKRLAFDPSIATCVRCAR